MAKMMFMWILAILATLVQCDVEKECPPEEMLSSCKCIEFDEGNILNCANIWNVSDLIQDLHAIKGYDIYQINLWQVDFQYIPGGFLKYLPITGFTITESTILALESDDGKIMFEGATESLTDIFIIAVEGVASWRWKPLEALSYLERLHVTTSEVKAILADFNTFSVYLKEISLNDNKISFIDDKAFSNYHYLKKLNLASNEISEIKRSMFPNPALYLETLRLSTNKIETLPQDVFTNMPQLKNLYLAANKLQSLPAEPFAPIDQQLQLLYLNGNDIRCCSDFEWVIASVLKTNIKGTCKFPEILAGKEISTLDVADMKHGIC